MKNIYCLLFLCISCFSAYSQWLQTNGPEGGMVDVFPFQSEIFAGTGDGEVYYSNNNGQQWQLILPRMYFSSVSSIVKMQNRLYVKIAQVNSFLYTDDNGLNWYEDSINLMPWYHDGIFIRGQMLSNDSGLTWNSFSGLGNPNTFCRDGNDIVLIGSSVCRSSDGGVTWNSFQSSQSNISNLIKYGNKFYCLISQYVYQSSDSCISWQRIPSLVNTNVFGLQKDSLALYVKGANSELLVSVDSGSTWTRSDFGLYNSRVYGIYSDGINVFASGVGVFVTADHGQNWNERFTNMINTSVTHLTKKDSTIFAASNTGGYFYTTDNGISWQLLNVDSFVNISSGSEVFEYHGYIYIACGNIYRSADNGITWTVFNVGSTFLTQNSLSSNDSLLISSGNSGVYISRDDGNTWEAKGNFYTMGNPIAAFGENIFVCRGDSLFISHDNGNTWMADSTLTGYIKNGKTIDHRVYVCDMDDGVYYSNDSGTTWYDFLNRNLIVNLVFSDSIVIAQSQSNLVYFTIDHGLTWDSIPYPTVNAGIGGLLYDNGIIYSGLWGAGVWKIDLLNIILKSNTLESRKYQLLFPNPTSDFIWINDLIDQKGLSYSIFTSIGQMVKSGNIDFSRINVQELSAGLYFLKLERNAEIFKFIKF